MTEIKTRADFGALLKEKNMLGAAAEIGVAEGRYASQILSWGVEKLYLVDLWRHVPGLSGCCRKTETHAANFAACQKIAEEHPGRVVILRGWSHERVTEIADESLCFLHLDATHERELKMDQIGPVGVKRDLNLWWPKLRPGGIMSGHDYLNPAYTVQAAADEFAASLGLKLQVADPERINDACFWFEKAEGS